MKRNVLVAVLTVIFSMSILAQEAEQKSDNRPLEFHLTFINLGAEVGYRIIGPQRDEDGGTLNRMFIALKWGR